MTKQEKIKSVRSLGVVGVTALATVLARGPLAIAQDETGPSAQQGLDKAVPADSENAVDIFATEDGEAGIFERVVNLLLFLVGAISVIMLIIGGIRYIVSSGDQNQVTGAKNTIMYAIIGIIVAVLAYGIVNFLLGRLYNTTV